MTIRIEVDFNMYDDGFFLAVTDEALQVGDSFVAYDVEDHEMMTVVACVEDGLVYFSELRASIAVPVVKPSGITWSGTYLGEQLDVQPGVANFVFEGNRPRTPVDA